jgi:signal peptidase
LSRSVKITVLILVPLTLLAALILVLTGSLPYKAYAVRTGSMSPTIPPKSAVIVRKGQYRIGEVITFKAEDTLITHRLVAIHEDGTTDTKGDANRTIDPWHARTTDIVGGVVAAPRMVGYWLVFFRNPVNIVALVLFVLMCYQVYDLVTEDDPTTPNQA